MSDAHAKLNVLLSDTTVEGASFRRAQELKLHRASIPVFPLTWTIMHTMDEKSPLHGFDAERFVGADARVFISLEARDPSIAATVQDLRSYPPAAVKFGMRYADVISNDEQGAPVADLTRLSALQPDGGAAPPEPGWSETEELAEE